MQELSEAARIDAEAAADAAVGFGKRGYEMRRPFWDSSSMSNVAGKTVVVTGGAAGVGLGAARSLAQLGAAVVVVSRDETRGREAVQDIVASSGNSRVQWVGCDLASLDSVRDAAAQILDL